jgi:AcrR family transcriptional regulator
LAGSPSGEFSTRAVCEAAGVTQPVLYRIFGDKDGLLAAVVDSVWDEYLSMKRGAQKSSDPLEDLYSGWASHVDFALAHPHAYRLLFSSTLSRRPEAGAEAMRLLRENLERLAAEGRLRTTPEEAARIVMAANSGVSLALTLNAEEYPDLLISDATRDAVYRSLLVASPDGSAGAAFVAATTLRASLAAPGLLGEFTCAESALLDEWLDRVQTRMNPN